MIFRTAAVALALSVSAVSVQAATLADLLDPNKPSSITVGDLTFDSFSFTDSSDITNNPNETPVSASDINMTTSSTATTVTLTATVVPRLALAGPDGFFGFLLDFVASVAGSSERTISQVLLDGGDLSASGEGFVEATHDVFDGATDLGNLDIFEDPSASNAADQSQTSASLSSGAAKSLGVEGEVEGETSEGGDTAGLGTYSLTFTLAGDPPVIPVVPLPAGLSLLLGGLAAFGVLKARRRIS